MAHLFLTPNPSLDEVHGEIIFKEIQLQTLDPDSDSYTEDRARYEDELAQLQQLLDQQTNSNTALREPGEPESAHAEQGFMPSHEESTVPAAGYPPTLPNGGARRRHPSLSSPPATSGSFNMPSSSSSTPFQPQHGSPLRHLAHSSHLTAPAAPTATTSSSSASASADMFPFTSASFATDNFDHLPAPPHSGSAYQAHNRHLQQQQDHQTNPRRSSSSSSMTLSAMHSPPTFPSNASTSGSSYISRKRSRPDGLSMVGNRGSEAGMKLYRPTPSPTGTGASTPATVDSFDISGQNTPLPSGSAFDGSSNRNGYMDRVRQLEEAAKLKRAQEEQDAMMALSLQNASAPQSQRRSSSQGTFQTVLNRDLSFRRVSTPSRTLPSASSSQAMSSGSQSQSSYDGTNGQNGYSQPSASGSGSASDFQTARSFIKNEPYQSAGQSMPGAWPMDTSVSSTAPSVSLGGGFSGAEEENDSDSSLEEISPEAYRRSAPARFNQNRMGSVPRSAAQQQQQPNSGSAFANLSFSSPLLGENSNYSAFGPDPFMDLDAFYTGQQLPGAGATLGQYTQPNSARGQAMNGGFGSQPSPFDSMAYNIFDVVSDVGNDPLGFGMALLEQPVPGANVSNGFIDSLSTLNSLINGPNAPINNLVAVQQTSNSWGSLAASSGNLMGNDTLMQGIISIDDSDNEYDYNRTRYNYLYADPTRNKEDLDNLLANIRPDEELPPHLREGTPEALKTTLMEHQKLGLSWLKKMEESTNKGGILADDMGLGKTIQALALIVSRPSDDPRCKTTLIVAPVALMRQWKEEIEEKIKVSHKLSVHVNHGTGRKTRFSDLAKFDVVLTTYGTLGQEFRKREDWEKKLEVNPSAIPTDKERLSLIGDDCKWYRVILDEAQCIKNKGTLAARGACKLTSTYRLCMTGTPMMNNVDELFSLIQFLRIRPYNEWVKFKNEFTQPLRSTWAGSRDKAMKTLQALLKAILLRRTKTSKIDGKPLLSLPDRVMDRADVEFDDDEMAFYKSLETNTQLQFNKYLKKGTVGKNYSNVLVLLLRLRQACCHPHLIKDHAQAIPGSAEEKEDVARGLSAAVIERIKAVEPPFECPVCIEPVDNPAIFTCGHDVCSECFVVLSNPGAAIAQGDEQGRTKCPECRAIVDPNKITDYLAFRKIHMPETLKPEELGAAGEAGEGEEEDESSSDEEEEEDEENADDADEHGNLKGFVVEDGQEDEEGDGDDGNENEPDNATENATENGEGASNSVAPKPKAKAKAKAKGKGKGKAKKKKKPKKDVYKPMTLAELKKESLRNKEARRRYLKRLRRDWISSAKISQTMQLLEKIQQEDPTEKTIIFSQFTSLLDLLEVPIDRAGITYERYDGSMSATHRGEAITRFKTNRNSKVMLISLKAGNAGLNLTVASQVIILDPFWNPFIEEQAIDRAHRIGQQRNVHVHRILVENTVEDRIIQLQEKKREMINTALDENEARKIGRLGVRELAYLFGVTRDPTQNVPGATE